MTSAQTKLYWSYWRRCRVWLVGHGYSSSQADAKRHALHVEALGAEKSSKDFLNRDLDLVLAKFQSFFEADNLPAQLAAGEQVEWRRSHFIGRIQAIALHLGLKPGLEGSYIDGISRRLYGIQYHECDDKQLGVLIGILDRRYFQIHRKPFIPEHTLAKAGDDPF